MLDLETYKNLMIKDGYSEKYADYFIAQIQADCAQPQYDKKYGEWALSKGFLPRSAYAYGLNESNYQQYLSDYDYYKMWPVNNWMKIWVDDKLTLKYMLRGTEFEDLMPEYYFYAMQGGLRELADNPFPGEHTADTLRKILKLKGELACKPNNGSGSEGFFKLSDQSGKIFKNDKEELDPIQFETMVKDCNNYIYTEYLRPSKLFYQVHQLIHTMRIVILNLDGKNPRIIGGYFRFGTSKHGAANFMNSSPECSADFDFVANIDMDTGHIYKAKAVFFNKTVDMEKHPDTNIKVDFMIPNWEILKQKLFNISNYFVGIAYMGFDIGITENGPKIMEINTHPGIKYMQVFHPLYENEENRAWIEQRLAEK